MAGHSGDWRRRNVTCGFGRHSLLLSVSLPPSCSTGACDQEGRAAEAVEDLSRAVEISDPSPSFLHCFAKALKASTPGPG